MINESEADFRRDDSRPLSLFPSDPPGLLPRISFPLLLGPLALFQTFCYSLSAAIYLSQLIMYFLVRVNSFVSLSSIFGSSFRDFLSSSFDKLNVMFDVDGLTCRKAVKITSTIENAPMKMENPTACEGLFFH